MAYYDFTSETEKFPQYLTFNNFLNQTELKELTEKIEPWTSNWEQSKIYKVPDKANEIDLNTRKSLKSKVNDRTLFQFCNETFISKLNQHQTDGTTFKLVQDELELIKYTPGGYFKKHQDFVHFHSNQIKCYTLIFCLEGNCEGGETSIFLSDTEEIKCEQTKRPNGLLVMRNELWHAGNEVIEGEKIILKLNLLATKTDRVITIGFENEERTYMVDRTMIDKWSNSYLAGYLRFKNDVNKIKIEKFTFEEFSVVYRLLTYQQLPLEEIKANERTLDYFGYNFEVEAKVYNHYRHQFEVAIEKMTQFLDRQRYQDCLLVSASTDEYKQFKGYFETNRNIASVQWAYDEDYNIDFICVGGTLVYMAGKNYSKSIIDLKENRSVNEKMIKSLISGCILDYLENRDQTCRKCKNYLTEQIEQTGSSESETDDEDDADDDENDDDDEDEGNEKKHAKSCRYSEAREYMKRLIKFTGNELPFCKYLMHGILHFIELEYDEYGNLNTMDYIIDKKAVPTNTSNSFDLQKIQSIYPQIEKHLKAVTLIKSESERVVGAYECNEANYYEHTINLGLGFINLEKYMAATPLQQTAIFSPSFPNSSPIPDVSPDPATSPIPNAYSADHMTSLPAPPANKELNPITRK